MQGRKRVLVLLVRVMGNVVVVSDRGCGTALYYTVLYCTALYCTALYCTVLYHELSGDKTNA